MERAQSLEGSDTVPSVENEGGEGEVFIPLSKTIDIGFPTGFSHTRKVELPKGSIVLWVHLGHSMGVPQVP